MKAGLTKKAQTMYMKDENPAMRRVVAGVKKALKELVPGTKEIVNAWGVPTFVAQNPFALYMVGKKHVTFGFLLATSLPDPEGLLEGAGKNIRHVKLRSVEDLEKEGLRELIAAASRFEGGAANGREEGEGWVSELLAHFEAWGLCLAVRSSHWARIFSKFLLMTSRSASERFSI